MLTAKQGSKQNQPSSLPGLLPVNVGESRFEDITDWLPRAAVELN
jgi:hypothetical protein